MQTPPRDSWELPPAKGMGDLWAFERFLAEGASESTVAAFLHGLSSHPELNRGSKFLIEVFSEKGMLRDQVGFLCDLYSKGIYIDRHEGSRVALIYFSGLVDPTGFTLVRSRLSQMKVNCIYLYDASYMNYLFGLKQLGSGVQQTNSALLQCVRDLQADRIVTIGNSAGGFAAIEYALSLDAHASVTFSPFTSFTEEHHLKDGRGKAVVDRVRKADPDRLFDLIPLLAKRHPPLQLVCFFAEGMPKDAWHAKRVASCHGFPVRVNRLASHYVLGSLVTDGIFEDLIQPLSDGNDLDKSLALTLARFPSTLVADY